MSLERVKIHVIFGTSGLLSFRAPVVAHFHTETGNVSVSKHPGVGAPAAAVLMHFNTNPRPRSRAKKICRHLFAQPYVYRSVKEYRSPNCCLARLTRMHIFAGGSVILHVPT